MAVAGQSSINRAWVILADAASGQTDLQCLTVGGSLAGNAAAAQLVREVYNGGDSAVVLTRTLPSNRVYTLCQLEPGSTYRAGADAALPLGGFTLAFPGAKKGRQAGNLLVVVRNYYDEQPSKAHKVTTEKINFSTDIVPECHAIRFLNRGLNTVSVGDLILEPGQDIELTGLPGYSITSPLKVVFADEATGQTVSFAAFSPFI